MVFWLCKDNFTRHSEEKKKKREKKEKRWKESIKEWTGVDLGYKTRAAEDRGRLKVILVD